MASETKITEKTDTTTTTVTTSTVAPTPHTKRSLVTEVTPFVVRIKMNAAAAIVYKQKNNLSVGVTQFLHRIGGSKVSVNLGQLYDEVTKGNYELLELYILDAAFLEQYIEVADGRFNEWIEYVNQQNGSPLNSEQILAIQTAYHDPNVFRDIEVQCFKRDNIELFRDALAEVKASYGKE